MGALAWAPEDDEMEDVDIFPQQNSMEPIRRDSGIGTHTSSISELERTVITIATLRTAAGEVADPQASAPGSPG